MRKMDTTNRIWEEEIMDDFDLDKPQIIEIFKDLDKVNRLLGGTQITINGLRKLLRDRPKNKKYRILDVGCGNGTMLRKIADFGLKHAWDFELIGVDANPIAIEVAREQTIDYSNISYECINVFSKKFDRLQADIFLCTLTLHHFKDEEIVGLLQGLMDNVRIGVVVNDLHRSKTAFHLFRLFSTVFVRNHIALEDGLVSILRSFKRKDFRNYRAQLEGGEHQINWRWAFRYQWIIEVNHKLTKSGA